MIRKATVEDVATLVFLHLRFHGYGDGAWTDSAVRRYVTDAGDLLDRLNKLVRRLHHLQQASRPALAGRATTTRSDASPNSRLPRISVESGRSRRQRDHGTAGSGARPEVGEAEVPQASCAWTAARSP